MQTYKSLTRTTIAECADLPSCGIYIIAYMGRILYVGKAKQVGERLKGHIHNRGRELIGTWLEAMAFDWDNIRLDVLETPDDCDEEIWNKQAEEALIKRFQTMFNTALM